MHKQLSVVVRCAFYFVIGIVLVSFTFGASGQGTTDTIAKFTGPATLGDSNIRETGGNVGIGINPMNAFRLIVNGGIGATRNATSSALLVNQSGSGNIAEFRTGLSTVQAFIDAGGYARIGPAYPIPGDLASVRLIVYGMNSDSNGGVLAIDDTVPGGAQLRLGVSDSYAWIQSHGDLPLRMNELGNDVLLALGSNNVGVGTTTPSQKLTVNGNICATGTIGSCSDLRFKRNITVMAGALNKVMKLRGVVFDWKCDEFPEHAFDDDQQCGFIAQEVKDVLPEAVSKGSDGFYSVDYGRLTPLLVEAIKEQCGQIEELKKEIEVLKGMPAQTTPKVSSRD